MKMPYCTKNWWTFVVSGARTTPGSKVSNPCTSARNHLAKRGVPYTERNASREQDALKKLTGSLEVPVLVVGSQTLKGYLDSDWDAALDSAGYPRTPPPGMKAEAQPAPKAQTPAAKPDAAKSGAAKP